ncbi:hypothetical protein HNQ51_000457 [Inhella inkyongensis]|uniref:Uncharacterized protein n=1 Tax=Inhella inkyongensis TaxID=392593 RepID=A0A840S2U6_9BURK|nr:TRAP transporter TatT component family protein [Inhella inkyongensis]MBB5203164.1 hypothetical protein [Inhella inkyongensis]
MQGLRIGVLSAVFTGSLMLSGCTSLLLDRVADTLAEQQQAEEDDLPLARDAAAFYLKVSEAVLREQPSHTRLATAVTAGFTQYSYAFVAFEAEKLEERDARAAQALRERAARLYARARAHGQRALGVGPLRLDQVALAHWTASAWAAQIALSKQSPEVVAELPQALALAARAYALAPEHGQGDLAALMGNLEANRPGGRIDLARRYFAEAQALSQGRSAAIWVAQAEALAQPAGDRATFEAELQRAVAAAQGQKNLVSTLMRERAQWLLQRLDDLF